MRRREFITLAAGICAWASDVRAQETVRRVAVIMVTQETNPEGQRRLKAFLKGLETLGWKEGRNVSIDVRWAGGNDARMREIATEIVTRKPDLIVAGGTPTVAALKRATSSIPVIFAGVNEPIAQGFIASMEHPGGNITGFTQVDFSVVGKSVEMLKAMAPALTHIGLMYNPQTYGFYDAYLNKFQSEARWSIKLTRAAVRKTADIDVVVADVASRPDGIVVMSDAFNLINQRTIHAALERYRLPHIVPWREYVVSGGLMSYGPDVADVFRRAADYADRILKGASPATLPAQAPTKYKLVINVKTAKRFGLTVPSNLIALADELIE